MAVVARMEQHDQRTAVVVADLFTDRTPVLSRDVDDHHIGQRPTPRQLQRCADHVDGAFLTEQSEQVDAQPHAPVQDHALPDLWCWHLSSLGWWATSGRNPGGPRFLGSEGTPFRGDDANALVQEVFALASGQVPHRALLAGEALHAHIRSLEQSPHTGLGIRSLTADGGGRGGRTGSAPLGATGEASPLTARGAPAGLPMPTPACSTVRR